MSTTLRDHSYICHRESVETRKYVFPKRFSKYVYCLILSSNTHVFTENPSKCMYSMKDGRGQEIHVVAMICGLILHFAGHLSINLLLLLLLLLFTGLKIPYVSGG